MLLGPHIPACPLELQAVISLNFTMTHVFDVSILLVDATEGTARNPGKWIVKKTSKRSFHQYFIALFCVVYFVQRFGHTENCNVTRRFIYTCILVTSIIQT